MQGKKILEYYSPQYQMPRYKKCQLQMGALETGPLLAVSQCAVLQFAAPPATTKLSFEHFNVPYSHVQLSVFPLSI